MTTTKRTLAACCGAALLCGWAWAQEAPPLKKDPTVKSAKEQEALAAVQQSATEDARLKAIDAMLTNFADTEFKPLLLGMAMDLEESKNDVAQSQFYAQRLLEVEPKNPFAFATLATVISSNAREFDLDKEEKLAKIDKYAHAAIDNVKDYPKPFSRIPDDAWAAQKQDCLGRAHLSLGKAELLRKKFDAAIPEYKAAVDATGGTNPNFVYYLGTAYLKAGQPDAATAAFEKVLTMADASAQAKKFAEQGKVDAQKLKAAAKPAGDAPKQP